jgi:hypothetical protein
VEKFLTELLSSDQSSAIPGQFSKHLRERGLAIRTGLGANRTATAHVGRFSSLSTGISTRFSAEASENSKRRGETGSSGGNLRIEN